MGAVVLKNVEKRYGNQTACTDINLDIKEGEFFTFLGPSGCGKTTILRLIAGFITPEAGSVFLGGRDITHLEPEKRDVGMVFQNYALFPFMTVRENIEYGLKIKKQSSRVIKEKADHYLCMVGLEGYDNRQIAELSGGEQQRVAFARSLAIEPQVLLLDEPLSNLDARLRDSMRAELTALQKNLGITTIFVTHDQIEALTMSDRLGVFNKGRCIQIGSPEDIYQHPVDSFVARFVGETNLFSVETMKKSGLLGYENKLSSVTGSDSTHVSLRPEHIELSRKNPRNSLETHGVIQEKRYNGFSTEFFVHVGGVDIKVVRLNNGNKSENLEVGQQVFVGFSQDDLHVFSS